MKLRYIILLKLEKLFYQLIRRFKIYPPNDSIVIDSMENNKEWDAQKEILYLAIKYDLSKPVGTPRRLLDVSKIKELGWEAKISLEEGLRRSYE